MSGLEIVFRVFISVLSLLLTLGIWGGLRENSRVLREKWASAGPYILFTASFSLGVGFLPGWYTLITFFVLLIVFWSITTYETVVELRAMRREEEACKAFHHREWELTQPLLQAWHEAEGEVFDIKEAWRKEREALTDRYTQHLLAIENAENERRAAMKTRPPSPVPGVQEMEAEGVADGPELEHHRQQMQHINALIAEGDKRCEEAVHRLMPGVEEKHQAYERCYAELQAERPCGPNKNRSTT